MEGVKSSLSFAHDCTTGGHGEGEESIDDGSTQAPGTGSEM